MYRDRFYSWAFVCTALSFSAAAVHAAEQQLPEVKVESGIDTSGYNPPTATSATKIEAYADSPPASVLKSLPSSTT